MKKGQGAKMAGQDSRKKKDKKPSKWAEALRYLMSQRPNMGVVIEGYSETRKDKDKEKE